MVPVWVIAALALGGGGLSRADDPVPFEGALTIRYQAKKLGRREFALERLRGEGGWKVSCRLQGLRELDFDLKGRANAEYFKDRLSKLERAEPCPSGESSPYLIRSGKGIRGYCAGRPGYDVAADLFASLREMCEVRLEPEGSP